MRVSNSSSMRLLSGGIIKNKAAATSTSYQRLPTATATTLLPNKHGLNSIHTSCSNPNKQNQSNPSSFSRGDESRQSKPPSAKPSSSSSLLSPLSPSAPPKSTKPYSPTTVSLVTGIAKLMGYNSTTSTAIRVSSDLYDRCAERTDVERDFFYKECSLPPTYQTWFQLTNLHVWLLLVRFRSLPSGIASQYSQEITNHFFIDSESRMRERFGVQTARLVKGYMKDMHMQQRGSILGLDEALANGTDEKLATALWRNLYGGGWGKVDGVKRKLKGIDKTMEGEDPDENGLPELAKDLGAFSVENNPYAKAKEVESRDFSNQKAPAQKPSRGSEIQDANQRAILASDSPSENPLVNQFPELAFPIHLERLTIFVRKELLRLANLSDGEIMSGRVGGPGEKGQSIAAFGRI